MAACLLLPIFTMMEPWSSIIPGHKPSPVISAAQDCSQISAGGPSCFPIQETVIAEGLVFPTAVPLPLPVGFNWAALIICSHLTMGCWTSLLVLLLRSLSPSLFF